MMTVLRIDVNSMGAIDPTTKKSWNFVRCADFSPKMHQKRLAAGLHPDLFGLDSAWTPWGSSQCSPDPPARFKGYG